MVKVSVLEKSSILKKANINQFLKETQYLISFITNIPFSKIIGEKEVFLSKEQEKRLNSYLNRRANREPLQYILGYSMFWKDKFKVTKDVLIPRPESEFVVEETVKLLSADFCGTIVDCCTGSGCIGLSVAKEFKNALVVLTDISIKALQVAYENKNSLQCKNTWLINSNLLTTFKPSSVDMVLANPPYVEEENKHILQKEVVDFEPEIALFSGNDGLFLIKQLLEQALNILKPQGYLIFEFGKDQWEQIYKFINEKFGDKFSDCYTVKDLAGIIRVGVLKRAWKTNC